MPKTLRMAGTDVVFELDESVKMGERAQELATARGSNHNLLFSVRLPGQSNWSMIVVNPDLVPWFCLSEEDGAAPTIH